MATTRRTKAEQSHHTRRALLDIARTLFTAQGYAATSLEEITRRAGVTRGAISYHFRDKAGLFEAVFDEVRNEYLAALRTDIAAVDGDAWQRLMTGVELFLAAILDPSVRRIVYIDGPAVLVDWSSEQRRAPAIALLRAIFEPLMDAGLIDRLPLDALLRQLWALFFNAAVDVAHAEEGGIALHERVVVLRRILTGLRPLVSSSVDRRAVQKQEGSDSGSGSPPSPTRIR